MPSILKSDRNVPKPITCFKDLLHGENKDQFSIWTLSVRKDVNLTEVENQFAADAEMDGSGMGYEIDIPYFENRTGKNNF